MARYQYPSKRPIQSKGTANSNRKTVHLNPNKVKLDSAKETTRSVYYKTVRQKLRIISRGYWDLYQTHGNDEFPSQPGGLPERNPYLAPTCPQVYSEHLSTDADRHRPRSMSPSHSKVTRRVQYASSSQRRKQKMSSSPNRM